MGTRGQGWIAQLISTTALHMPSHAEDEGLQSTAEPKI